MSDGRFSSLEFDESARGPRPAEPAKGERPAAAQVKDAQYYIRQAEQQELAGDLDQALRSYSAALDENPLLLDAWVGQLVMLLALGEYPETRVWAGKALEKFPDNPQVLAAKSVALYRMGHRREARDMIDAALEARGESDVVWLCRGEIMLAASGPAAENCLQHALRLASRKSLAQLRIAALYLRHRKYSRALAALQDLMRAEPRAAAPWYLLGAAQEKIGRFHDARISYQQAVELAPRNATYQRAAAMAGRGLGHRLAGLFRRVFGG